MSSVPTPAILTPALTKKAMADAVIDDRNKVRK